MAVPFGDILPVVSNTLKFGPLRAPTLGLVTSSHVVF